MRQVRVLLCLLAMALLLNACLLPGFMGPHSEGRELYRDIFRRGNPADAIEELEKHSLEQQYQVFLFGMHRVHPPDHEPAYAIAKRGKPALDYVLRRVAALDTDYDYVISLDVFRAMVRGGHYLVCDDVEAMRQIEANGHKIAADALWKETYQRELRWMQEECARQRGEQHGSAAAPRGHRLGVSGPAEGKN